MDKNRFTFEEVFSFSNLYEASKECLRNTRWKASTIAFGSNLLGMAEILRQELNAGTYSQLGFSSFKLSERGKTRNIDSIHIRDRAVQKCLCQNLLMPVLAPVLIQDTYACIPEKGLHAFEKRITSYEHSLYQKAGSNNFYVLQMDMHSYFESIDHEILKIMLKRYIHDEKLMSFISTIIDTFNMRSVCSEKGKGLCLGSETAQILGQFYLSPADHFAREKLKAKYYARYNDDIVIYSESREYLKETFESIKSFLFKKLKIEVNSSKCKITKCSHNYTVLKTRRRVLPNGRILRLPASGTRRRKLNDFKNIMRHKKASYSHVQESLEGFKSHVKSRHIRANNMIKALEKETQEAYDEKLSEPYNESKGVHLLESV